ncbi:hypothetical protein ACRCUN_03520 [Mycobacterium sp. LTG2003]
MTISADDVRRLLASDASDAVLVLVQGRTEVVPQDQLESDRYRGALQVASRAELLSRTGDAQLSEHEMAEEAAKLESTIANLGG